MRRTLPANNMTLAVSPRTMRASPCRTMCVPPVQFLLLKPACAPPYGLRPRGVNLKARKVLARVTHCGQ